MNYPKVLAVDFDGCLCVNKWPEIGDPNWNAIHTLLDHKSDGGKVILWTCREGQMLEDAVMWCLNHGLKFDAVNDNLPENKEYFGNNCRKVWANEYWDDKAVPVAAYDCPIAGRIIEIKEKPEPERKSFLQKIKEWLRE